MTSDEINKILNAAAAILIENQSVNIVFAKDNTKIKLPTTRELAKKLNTPHYYILPGFSMMEKKNLVTREERIGIWTTNEGTDLLLLIMHERYSEEIKKILGVSIFDALAKK